NTVMSDPAVIAAVKAAEDELGSNGRMLVRPSGTEPLLRIMAEAQTEDICNKYIAMVENAVRERGYIL
ncbi:MAG: phosphoglucosamine mutase, partial [Oscillospiraceae bacterium]|nr:phosphoglucosamine mutase [Oscillospiraceae bacterium]